MSEIDWPLVYVVMTTYNRTAGAKKTLEGLVEKLGYAKLAWHIADDGSDPGHVDCLLEYLKSVRPGSLISVTNAQRRGVGVSKNIALRTVFDFTPFVFMLEDDWYLTQPFDLYPHVKLLMDQASIGMVRFGFLGGPLKASYGDMNGPFSTYWLLERGSGVYVYSGQISLRHKRFYDKCGFHPEGVPPGKEEEMFCHHYNSVDDAPGIVWPATLPSAWGPFQHIAQESLNNIQPVSA